MLKIDDPRWATLTSFFGEGEEIPSAITEWLNTIGTADEARTYDEGISELVLHQNTITNGAFALAPWLLHVYARADTEFRWKYMTDIAIIEANRLSGGVYYNREGTEACPDWLMAPYHAAVKTARLVAQDLVRLDSAAAQKCGLLALMPAFDGDGDKAWAQWRSRW